LSRPDDTAVSLGRDKRCQFVLTGRKASRVHARIERRRDKFFLIDQSTNGTCVTFAGEAEIVLRREEVMLRGSGSITFAHSTAESSKGSLTFIRR
jgi:pSer/pThr/pTyr-binding forkhead associated (FHA) protein